MSTGIQIAEADWSVPATKGELMLVQSDLSSKIDQVAADLDGTIEVGLKDVELGMSRMIWIAAGTLSAVGVLLRLW